jgi:uncharacterized peroxidase-related enzyme
MTRVEPLPRDGLSPEAAAAIDRAERLMGFAPNDALVMARRPALLRAVGALVEAAYGGGRLDAGLKRLIGEATSKAAGCFYCAAHAADGARGRGVADHKIAAVWSYEDSPKFTEAERAAIRVGMNAGMTPNATTDADFAELRRHFDDDEIVEIVAVIALFGFLNRWNSTLATTLEPRPADTLTALGLT